MTDTLHRPGNAILRQLPDGEYRQIAQYLRPVGLSRLDVLQEWGECPDRLYFPTSGMCSVVVPLSTGVDVEVGMIGSEGVVNAGAVECLIPSSVRVYFSHTEGKAVELPISLVLGQVHRLPTLVEQCGLYASYLYAQAAQSAACNGQHDVLSRLARWLLQASDTLRIDILPLTQEFLADTLGVRRPTVSIAAQELQRAGIIAYRRRDIQIIDRRKLEDTACECHGIVKDMYTRFGAIDG